MQPILVRYVNGPDILEAAIGGLSEEGLNHALDARSWTIRQIVHHVVDGDDLWKVYIKAALGNPQRVLTLQWYWDVPQVTWADTWAYVDRSVGPSLYLLRASRRHVAQLLEHIPGAWHRKMAIRWPGGEESVLAVGDIVETQSDHVTQHASDIRAIRELHRI